MNHIGIKEPNPGCHKWNCLKCAFGIALLVAGLSAQPTRAQTGYRISWLDLSSVPVGSSVAKGTTFTLPGYGGVVTVSYTSTNVAWTHFSRPAAQNGYIMSPAGDYYDWTSADYLSAFYSLEPPSAVDYNLTFSFSVLSVPAGKLALASMGLGGSFNTGPTLATVFQNGTFLGDWDISTSDFICGPTAFIPGTDTFGLTNSWIEPTPGYFNSRWGVTRIDGSITTNLTIHVHHVGYDGIGFTIGWIGPRPAQVVVNSMTNGSASIDWSTNTLPYTWQPQVSMDLLHWTTLSNTIPPIIIPPYGPSAPAMQFYRLICTNSP